MNVITSNPSLQERYGGVVVPHVREVGGPPRRRCRTTEPFTVGFIGTPREHKGLEEIRAATAHLARKRDVRLCITASPPADARPWEHWVGETSLAEGRKLLEQCDAVAVVSRPGVWGDLQLPVKLIDAMAAGVPAVITARAPLLWAAGGAAVVVRDESVSDLRDALSMIADNSPLAEALANTAWRRARELFTPAAAAAHLTSTTVL
jgi:glycosyltransferase involved in cell wall biosynthesis